jgi:hypothetical protein
MLMKSKVIYPVIIMTAFFLFLNGCGTFDKNLGILQLQTQRSVENNVFTSSFPEIKLQISQDLKYLGTVQLAESVETRISDKVNPGDRSLEANSYLFGQIGQNNRIAKGVLIRVLVMYGDPSQVVPEIFFKTGANILESGEMKIIEAQYQYNLYSAPELLAPKEKDLLAGSRIPSCFLVKQLSSKSGLGNKSRIQIFYFEDLAGICGNQPCGTCLESQNRTTEQKQFINEFTDRSFTTIRFMKTRTVEDTTSRYVDTETKVQAAPVEKVQPVEKVLPKPLPIEKVQPAPVEKLQHIPVEKASPVVEPTKTDTVEKRLEALKRVYEKNLISKEDYEKKKTEILKEL